MVIITSEAEDAEAQKQMELRMQDPKLHSLLQQALTKVKGAAIPAGARVAKMVFIAQHSVAGAE
jgi:hypothetical protein